jgi:hypothetical protein
VRRDFRLHEIHPRRRSFLWLDVLAAVLAATGITVVTLINLNYRGTDYAASDFKTLYASIWCYTQGWNAYSISNLQKVFVANGVVEPPSWYGHAPVYPWTTLALGAPLCKLGMVAACYTVTILDAILLAAGMFALARYAARQFNLGPIWRLAIPGLCAGAPLVAFGLDMDNVSLPASALCFLAFTQRDAGARHGSRVLRWAPVVALAGAFLLKPHLAIWVGLAMAALPERNGRAVVLRSLVLVAGFTALTAGVMAATGTLGMQTHAYLAMLRSETGPGASMSAASHELLPWVAQITSLDSIVGFWTGSAALRVGVTFIVLLGLAWPLWRQTRRVNTERGALLATGAWCVLGLLATYHRAHDAALLLLLVPWVVDRVRRAPLTWHAWAVALLYCVMSASPAFAVVQRWVAGVPVHSLTAFLLMRQVGLADLLLLLVVQLALVRENAGVREHRVPMVDAEELRVAA